MVVATKLKEQREAEAKARRIGGELSPTVGTRGKGA